MLTNPRSHHERAINALASLIGHNGQSKYFGIIPRALLLPCGVAVLAGDESRAVDPFGLRALALKHGVSVLCTWTDKMLSGHNFEIDVVLNEAGQATHYQALRLWLIEHRGAYLIPPEGNAASIRIDAAGVRLAARAPYRNKADCMLGIASGQALLQRLIFGGMPLAQNIGR